MRASLAVVAAAALVACSGEPFEATTETVAGDYSLGWLTTTDTSGATTDWLAAGATLDISLTVNGTTTGHLFIPGGAAGGGDFDADLTGTWSLVHNAVFFNQPADTFMRDMTFFAHRGRLEGDHQLDVRVTVVLTK